ncbi:MAG: hypothetical protein EBY32_20500 [Proteobacteria bacterium]|nr:hypothetical protein [Pseudomonadota bacterium]
MARSSNSSRKPEPTSAEQLALVPISSPSPKPAPSSNSNRLTPSEIESLRKDMREAAEWMDLELAKQD